MSLVRRAVRGEANSFGRNSMLTNRGCCGKTQGQSCFERLRGEFGLIKRAIRNWRLFFTERFSCRQSGQMNPSAEDPRFDIMGVIRRFA
jgi:hypothetical protein